MKAKHASDTAGYTSAMRAIANLAPKAEKYLDDSFSVEFLPFPWFLTKPLFLARLFDPVIYSIGMKTPDKLVGFPGMTALACLRHRYIDDQILNAYKAGARRFIFLGAGYDTRSLRLPLPEATIIEVDHPDTQKRKKEILKRKHLQPNCKLEFIAIDFSKSWAEILLSHPYIKDTSTQTTMVIWEGVCCYLQENEVLHTITAVRQLLQPGGTLVFDAFSAELLNEETPVEILRKMRSFVEKKGEPFRWAEDETLIREMITAHDFKEVDTLSIYDAAADLSEKESLNISKDEILKYLRMYCCHV
ncbi:MAG: class I SAM-dependent methyltransferase [Gammaproteobacteria bacterium]|nr:class I SAM-dependent methyltransferase [Gammaproteobacteria bacterium]